MWFVIYPEKNLSVDEAMVKYKGRSSIKQYQPLKPIKRGLKVWCRAESANGYVDYFVVYTENQMIPLLKIKDTKCCNESLQKYFGERIP